MRSGTYWYLWGLGYFAVALDSPRGFTALATGMVYSKLTEKETATEQIATGWSLESTWQV